MIHDEETAATSRHELRYEQKNKGIVLKALLTRRRQKQNAWTNYAILENTK
jgi:hypothetical protein